MFHTPSLILLVTTRCYVSLGPGIALECSFVPAGTMISVLMNSPGWGGFFIGMVYPAWTCNSGTC